MMLLVLELTCHGYTHVQIDIIRIFFRVYLLVGGLEHVSSFFHILGMIIPTD